MDWQGSSAQEGQIRLTMKLQNKNTGQETNTTRLANPIHDIINSTKRGCLRVSEEDMEILRQLKQNPPPPTTEFVEMLQQHLTTTKPKANRTIVP
jgi:DNA replication protein DnaD